MLCAKYNLQSERTFETPCTRAFFHEMLKRKWAVWEKVKWNVKLFNILFLPFYIFLGLTVT